MGREQDSGQQEPQYTQDTHQSLRMLDGSPISGSAVIDEIMERIEPDGSVYQTREPSKRVTKRRIWQLKPDEVVDFSQLSPDDIFQRQLFLADMVYSYIQGPYRKFATDKRTWYGAKNDREYTIAHVFAGVRHNPAFIAGVKQLVHEGIEQYERPSKLVRQPETQQEQSPATVVFNAALPPEEGRKETP